MHVVGISDCKVGKGADETVIVTLTGTDNANAPVNSAADNATVAITDDDTPKVSITATDATATEAGTTTGTFTVSLDGGISDTEAESIQYEPRAHLDHVLLVDRSNSMAGPTA